MWNEILYKIPWCVVLTAINDQPKYESKKKKDEGEITSVEEAKHFFKL